jgi:hypothetical protein
MKHRERKKAAYHQEINIISNLLHAILQLYGLGLVTYTNSELLLKLLIISTIGRTPWTGDQFDATTLPTHDNTTERQ